jgi:hypothetical protein
MKLDLRLLREDIDRLDRLYGELLEAVGGTEWIKIEELLINIRKAAYSLLSTQVALSRRVSAFTVRRWRPKG